MTLLTFYNLGERFFEGKDNCPTALKVLLGQSEKKHGGKDEKNE